MTFFNSENGLLADSIKLIEISRSKIYEVSGIEISEKCEDVFKKERFFVLLRKFQKCCPVTKNYQATTRRGIINTHLSHPLILNAVFRATKIC